MNGLGRETIDHIVERLGLEALPEPTAAGLAQVYLAWCRGVPFDNLVKRVHMVSGDAAPLPNGPPAAFFDLYLRHGTGGTCWPSTLALHALLTTLGFDARLGSAAMRDDLVGPVHSHATVIVRVDGGEWWVDSSMLTDAPVPLVRGEASRLDHPLRPVRVEPVGDLWRVHWWPAAISEEFGCLLLDDDVTVAHCLARYEASRELSPFNTHVYATRNVESGAVTIALGQFHERDADGVRSGKPPDGLGRMLVEEFGYSEEIVAQLPPDGT